MAPTVPRTDSAKDFSEEGINRGIEYLRDTALTPTRNPTSADDWGDEETVGLQVRELKDGRAVPIDEQKDGSWGRYLGEHGGKYVVLMLSLFYRPFGVAEYSSVEDMKRDWCLD